MTTLQTRYRHVSIGAFALLCLCIVVILWGAFVRFSHSGDGCGESWPLCHGSVVPLLGGSAIWIEYVHRLTSGLYGVGVVALVVFIFRRIQERTTLHFFALGVLFFTVTEALIGAGLVLRGMVAENTSLERILWLVGHLINTLFLLYFLVGMFFQSKFPDWRCKRFPRLRYTLPLLLFVALAMLGSIASLSNTLYPSTELAAGIAEDFSSESPLLVRLRIIHPLLGVLFFLSLAFFWSPYQSVRVPFGKPLGAGVLIALCGVTAIIGLCTLLLLSPLPARLLHLLLADLVWIHLVGLALFAEQKRTAHEHAF